MKRISLIDLAVVVLTACAVVVTGLVVRREFARGDAGPPRPRAVAEWRTFARDGHMMGPASAPVKVVVFSDFQCPYCAMLAQRLRTLRTEYPAQVVVLYRHFPLATHPYAIAAARASECAAAQGRFEAFHDALFAAQDSIGVVPFGRFAAMAGVRDTAAFRECTMRTGPVPALAHDTVAGRRLDVRGTPTLLINQTLLRGAQPLDTLEAYVERALRRPS